MISKEDSEWQTKEEKEEKEMKWWREEERSGRIGRRLIHRAWHTLERVKKNVFGIPMEETEEFEDQRKRLDGNEPVSITT